MRFIPLALILTLLVSAPARAAKQPNVLLIMADDKCDDLGTMGAEEVEIVGKRASRPQ